VTTLKIYWQETALNPVSLASLCGKYRFVWEGEQLMEEFGAESNAAGGMTLACGGDSTIDNMSGSLLFGSVHGTFRGFSVRHDFADRKIPNCWAFFHSRLRNYGEEGENDEDDDEDMHAITALEVRDDNGQQFVEFGYEAGWSGCCPQYLAYIAKKQVNEGRPEALSDAEKMRLGMGLETKEVMERGKRKEPIPPESSGSSIRGTKKPKARSKESKSKEMIKGNKKKDPIPPVKSESSGSSVRAAMKRKAESDEDGEDGNQRLTIKIKLRHV
jgi:hypothetical protein